MRGRGSLSGCHSGAVMFSKFPGRLLSRYQAMDTAITANCLVVKSSLTFPVLIISATSEYNICQRQVVSSREKAPRAWKSLSRHVGTKFLSKWSALFTRREEFVRNLESIYTSVEVWPGPLIILTLFPHNQILDGLYQHGARITLCNDSGNITVLHQPQVAFSNLIGYLPKSAFFSRHNGINIYAEQCGQWEFSPQRCCRMLSSPLLTGLSKAQYQ